MSLAASATFNPRQSAPSTTHHAHRPRLLDAALIVAWSLAMHLPWLAPTPLDGTEGHRAIPAHAMVQTGHWVVPMLFGHPYLAKPPFHYWLIAISESIFRHATPLVWRLPSATSGGLLAGVACWFAGRWFGRTAGWIAGASIVGMITLWGQSQVADIDATDVLAAALTAFCGIELFIRSRASWRLLLPCGLFFGMGLLTKGPSALLVVLPVWLFGTIENLRLARRPWRSVAIRWLPLLIGFALFGIYAWIALNALKHAGFGPELSGIREAGSRMKPQTELGALKSLAVMPGSLFLFAMPVSLALPLLMNRPVRESFDPDEWRLVKFLVATILGGWVFCVLAGLLNPRYGYTTLPPLAPLAGAVAIAAWRSDAGRGLLRSLAAGVAVLFSLATIVLACAAWSDHRLRVLLAASAILSTFCTAQLFSRISASFGAAWLLAPLIFLTAIPFSAQRFEARSKASGYNKAAMLRSIVGDMPVACGGAITSKPEVFFYAGTNVDYFPMNYAPGTVPPDMWVVVDRGEKARWLRDPRVRLSRLVQLYRAGSSDDSIHYLAWYSRATTDASAPASLATSQTQP